VTVPEVGLIAVIVNNEGEVWCSILVLGIKIGGVIEAHVGTLPEISHTEEEDNFNVVVLNACILISS
jgi:hypothetical protein